jgi:hypothetical protein
MKEHGWIEPIVERVVGQVLDSHAAQLRTEIARRVMEEIVAAPTTDNASSASGAAELARAVAEIQLGASQREILRALLDASARYAARVALFVVKGSHAIGWQSRGFANNDAMKDFALDENAPAVVSVIGRANGDRALASAPVADLDPRFLEVFGTPASGEAWIFPLMLKDKVAALVYADSGTPAASLLDAGSLELLVLSTSAWLEVNSLRKQAQKEPSAAARRPRRRHRLRTLWRSATIPSPLMLLAAPWRQRRRRAKPRRQPPPQLRLQFQFPFHFQRRPPRA